MSTSIYTQFIYTDCLYNSPHKVEKVDRELYKIHYVYCSSFLYSVFLKIDPWTLSLYEYFFCNNTNTDSGTRVANHTL